MESLQNRILDEDILEHLRLTRSARVRVKKDISAIKMHLERISYLRSKKEGEPI